MDNVTEVIFDPRFRAQVAQDIKHFGHKRVEAGLLKSNFNPAFVKALIRSIMSREGW